MKVTNDGEHYDELQILLIEEIVATLRDGLREAGVTEPRVLADATSTLAFAIAAILDGTHELTVDGVEVVPVVTFARERDGDELIAPESGGSWMRDYVPGLLLPVAVADVDRDDEEFDESIDLGSDDER